MKYALHFGPEALHIRMEGSFTFMDSRLFHRMLGVFAKDETRAMVRINLRNVPVMDRTGLRLMMHAHDLAKKTHRRLVFEEASGQVRAALAEAARYNVLHMAA